jgi:hypothetical protein
MDPQEQHEYVYAVDGTCCYCGAVENDNEPWLPQHNVPEGWD